MVKPQVLILAGGVGKRFWPLKTNKFLFPFMGKPLLVHNLERLQAAGFDHAVIVTTPEDESQLSKISLPNFSLNIVVQPKAEGMADAVLTGWPKLDNNPLLIMSATDLMEPGLYQEAYSAITKGENFFVAKKVDHFFPGGYLKMNGDQVEAIIEKPGPGNEPSDLVNLVFDGFQNPKAFIDELKNTTSSREDIYEIAFTNLLSTTKFSLIKCTGYWQATKYPWHLLDVMNILFAEFKQSLDHSASISPKATIEGNVIIEAGTKVYEGAVIKGPVYIGKNTIIGNNALIRQSMIGKNCVVGYNTEVARSYVGNNNWFHSNYIGDSVLENNISFGAGSILANLRLDEGEINSEVKAEKISTQRNKLGAIIGSNVRIGVNTSIMPGIKIGHSSAIGAGLTVACDIPDNSFVKASTILDISPNKIHLDPENREKFKSKL